MKEALSNKVGLASLIFLAAFFILSFVFLNILIATILFIVKIGISKYTVIIAFIMSSILVTYFLKISKPFISVNKTTCVFISVIFPILVILFSIFVSGKVVDTSFDGNSYQKAIVGKLKNGWNPIYESVEDFESKEEIKTEVKDENIIYINSYAKASNIFAANIYKLTENIESGKSINIISATMIFLFTFSLMLHKKNTYTFSLLFSMCVATHPVIGAQWLTNYLDLLVYVFLYLTLYVFFLLEEKDFILSKNEILVLYIMILSIAINIKVSLFAYATIFCMGYFAWYIIRATKKEMDFNFLKRFIFASILSAFIGVFIIGLSVYPKNFIKHGHPFYPIIGEKKVDIIGSNEPKYFKSKSPIEKFIISNFSKVSDIYGTSETKAEYKIPFTFSKEEIINSSLPDTRISGGGVWYGAILLISLICTLMIARKIFKSNKKLFCLCGIPLIITAIMMFTLEESWWTRYFPQSYFVILCAIIFINKCAKKNRIGRILKYTIIFLIIFNNVMTFTSAARRVYNNNIAYEKEFMEFESSEYLSDETLELYAGPFHGAKYNVIDRYSRTI